MRQVRAIYKLNRILTQRYSTTGSSIKIDEKTGPASENSLEKFLKGGALATDNEVFKKSVAFEEMPGPAVLKHISKAWSYVPIVGNQMTANTIQYLLSAGKIFGNQLSWGNNLWLFKYLLDEYGPVVRLHGPFGGNVVILSRPEHASVVFDNEGPYPVRSSLDCIERYRLEHRHYKQAGPFVMYGPEWKKLRETIEAPLRRSVTDQHAQIAVTSDEFIDRVLFLRNRQFEVPASFNEEIKKWSMECLCSIMFQKRIGFLDPQGLSSSSEPAVLLDNLNGATHAIRKCEFGLHMWKFFETPAWKRLVTHCAEIETVLQRHIRHAQDTLRERKSKSDNDDGTNTTATSATVSSTGELEPKHYFNNLSLVECFLLRDAMLAEDVLTILLDMLLIGVNMTAHTVGFLLYHLARNPRAQSKLHEEIEKMDADGTVGAGIDMKKMPYLKACLRESLRLKPPMPVLSRITTKNICVHGYQIPRGTFVLIATNLSSLREEHFEDALKFRPERWQDLSVSREMEALATIPFGHGPKACLARDLAETQISMLITKIMRKFRIEYHYGDIASTNRLLSAPDRPLKFRFVERT